MLRVNFNPLKVCNMTEKTKMRSFEASISELETLVNTLETGDLSLEDSLATFEKGVKLTKECQQQLSVAEQKVSMLVGEGEQMGLVDFNDSEN